MGQPLRVGIVGCGTISAAYLKTFARLNDVTVVAAADIDRSRAEAIAASHPGVRALSVDDLLADDQVGLVLNLTIPAAHGEVALRAIAAGAVVQYVPEIVQYHFVDPGRLQLGYVVRKAFERSASAVRLGSTGDGKGLVPPYMIRKAGGYSLAVLTSFGSNERRFHLVRLAASLGEIKGHMHAWMDGSAQSRS